jgi:hypothetical protein
MKKIFTFFLVVIFIFNIAGTEIIFSILLEQCREEAGELISGRKEKEREVLLVINSDNQKQLHRIENGEIEYDGMMYDVRKEVKSGSTILIYAYMDSKEENLKDNFASENQETNNPMKNGKAKINSKNLMPFYVNNFSNKDIPVKPSSLKNQFIKIKYLQPDIELATPPPQV